MSKSRRGRPKGSRNRLTRDVKEAILLVFEGIGGVQRMIDWVNRNEANETAFFTKIYPRLLPRPALDAPPEAAPLPPVRGALIWEKPTPAPYKPLAASTATVALAGGDGAELQRPCEAGEPPG